jgi:hypothetical protein
MLHRPLLLLLFLLLLLLASKYEFSERTSVGLSERMEGGFVMTKSSSCLLSAEYVGAGIPAFFHCSNEGMLTSSWKGRSSVNNNEWFCHVVRINQFLTFVVFQLCHQ